VYFSHDLGNYPAPEYLLRIVVIFPWFMHPWIRPLEDED
jgi:hypothetical protein